MFAQLYDNTGATVGTEFRVNTATASGQIDPSVAAVPGGGFIAGLITAIALITQYLANGIAWTQSRMRSDLPPMIGIGLLLALAENQPLAADLATLVL